MHPILADRKKLSAYLAAWLFVGAILSLAFLPTIEWSTSLLIAMPMALVYAFINLGSWYPNKASPLESSGLLRIVLVNVASATLSSAVWISFVGNTVAILLSWALTLPELPKQYRSHYAILFAAGILLYLLSSAVQYLVMTFENSREVERKAFELKLLAREAELRALRAQIDPHFLFNSLNSISALTTQNPSAARDMCVLLADFLRKSIKVGTQSRIPLREELDLLENFLAIERVRFGNRLNVDVKCDGKDTNSAVPPLLLQPLAENAIKHGISQRIEGGTIEIVVRGSVSRLDIQIRNPIDPDQKSKLGTGLGLQNVKSRLSNLYGNEARLDVEEKNGQFIVDISLPNEQSA